MRVGPSALLNNNTFPTNCWPDRIVSWHADPISTSAGAHIVSDCSTALAQVWIRPRLWRKPVPDAQVPRPGLHTKPLHVPMAREERAYDRSEVRRSAAFCVARCSSLIKPKLAREPAPAFDPGGVSRFELGVAEMAVWSEFEEKEFETLANVALVSEQVVRKRNVQVFSPGQVLEKSLGFDFATHIGKHTRLHRRLFGSTPGAPGATPDQLTMLKIPLAPSTRLLNVFLQYKRPEHFKTGHRSSLWSRQEEFLRFTVSENNVSGGGYHFDQVTALDELATSLGPTALVRYACPAVWTKSELYGLFGAGRLLADSVFVEPRKLADLIGADPYHRRWTFQRRLPGAGKPNPDGVLTSVETGESFMDRAEVESERAPRSDGYARDIVREAGEAQKVRSIVNSRKVKLRPRERNQADAEDMAINEELKRVPSLEVGTIRASLELATIARDLGAKWSVIAFPLSPQPQLEPSATRGNHAS